MIYYKYSKWGKFLYGSNFTWSKIAHIIWKLFKNSNVFHINNHIKYFHFKKTVEQSSFLSKALSFSLTLFWFQQKWQHFWKKWRLRYCLLKMKGLEILPILIQSSKLAISQTDLQLVTSHPLWLYWEPSQNRFVVYFVVLLLQWIFSFSLFSKEIVTTPPSSNLGIGKSYRNDKLARQICYISLVRSLLASLTHDA